MAAPETQGHRHLVGARRTNQAVNLVEVECGQLIHDDAHWDVSFGVDSGNQSVQHQCIQRTDDLFLLRVVGNHQVARMSFVRNLQVEVIPSKHPVGFRRYQSGGIDTKGTHHTFQLVVRFVLISTLEGRHEGSNLVVLHQNVEHLVVRPAEEGQHMWHVRILPSDGVRLHFLAFIIFVPAAFYVNSFTRPVQIREAV